MHLIKYSIFYRNILLGKLNAKRQRKQEKKAKETQSSSTLPWKNQSISPFIASGLSSHHLSNGASITVGVNRSASNSSMYKKKRNEQDFKRKLSKDDISLPSNFRYEFIYFYFILLLIRVYIYNFKI